MINNLLLGTTLIFFNSAKKIQSFIVQNQLLISFHRCIQTKHKSKTMNDNDLTVQELRKELDTANIIHCPKPPITHNHINKLNHPRRHRLFQCASTHQDTIDAEYQSLHRLHTEGRSGRRRSGKPNQRHLPKVASYLRESQPKSKYVTDPAALSGAGQQDLCSAAYLINQLEQGRVERMRRFQPKARRKRRKGKRKKKNNNKKKNKLPEWLNGIYLGQIEKKMQEKETTASATTKTTMDENQQKKQGPAVRLSIDPHAQPGEQMNFINKPKSYCQSEAKRIEISLTLNQHFLQSKHIKTMMSSLLNLLEDHDTSTNFTNGNSIWSSLPVKLENEIIQPTLAKYRKLHHHKESDADNDYDYESIPKKQKNSLGITKKKTARQRLLELKRLRESTFEEQVEGVVHNILKWFFSSYGGEQLGQSQPRSGRASVVKRYEELCKSTPHAISDIANLTKHHGIIVNKKDTTSKEEEQNTTDGKIDYIKQNVHDASIVHSKKSKKNPTIINYIQQNKMTKSLKIYTDESRDEKIVTSKKNRRKSVLLVKQRRQSVMMERIDDIEYNKRKRLERINYEMNQAIHERRGKFKTVPQLLTTIAFEPVLTFFTFFFFVLLLI